MVDTTALVGSARVGTALVGSLGTTPPSRVRVHGACWELVTDPAAVEAAKVAAAGTRILDRAPTPEDGAGLPVGAGIIQQDPTTGLMVAFWRWDGNQWHQSSLSGDAVTVTGSLSARVVSAMDAEVKRLIVTEEAILNHATLIGQTVVDDINVRGKLIGTDGVFTGTVDFENINVTDQVLAERLAGEHIYGTVVEGGEIRTTDGLPGQVILSDEGFVDSGDLSKRPGIRIVPPDMSQLASPPGIGPNPNGFIITGGRNVTGGRGFSIYSPRSTAMSFVEGSTRADMQVTKGYAWITTGDGTGNRGEIAAQSTFSQVKATAADGTLGVIEATPSSAVVATKDPGGNMMSRIMSNGREAYLWSTGSDGRGRVLSVDSDGVWVKVERGDGSGLWDHYNLTKTANDTGWINFTLRPGISGTGNPALRVKGGMVYFRGILTSSGTWAQGWTEVAGPFNAEYRPATTMLFPGAITDDRRNRLRMSGDGILSIYMSASIAGTAGVPLNPLSYVLG